MSLWCRHKAIRVETYPAVYSEMDLLSRMLKLLLWPVVSKTSDNDLKQNMHFVNNACLSLCNCHMKHKYSGVFIRTKCVLDSIIAGFFSKSKLQLPHC